MADILFELGCEELPPKALYGLSKALFDEVCAQLSEKGFAFAEDSRWYASPRRLAFILRDISEQLPDQQVEKRGPSVQAAFDDLGQPKPAAIGFARSVGAEVGDLQTLSTEKGDYLVYQVVEKGLNINALLPEIIGRSIKKMPIPKPMRWGRNEFAFIRPVHWLVLMNGDVVIPMGLFGHDSGRRTRGHRFHNNNWHDIPTALDYQIVLQQADIMVDHLERELLIKEQVQTAAAQVGGKALINSDLLQEVASITEKPVAVLGDFSTDFLEVPREALISSMEKHQKYFAIENEQGQLMPHFVAMANINSSNPSAVKQGFEKVITPRLADARFFWDKDRARSLEKNIPLLEKMIFEKSLGTIADKTKRIAKLMQWLQPQLGFDVDEAERAAKLMKSDLMSDMVDEFPDLQGLMGGYYAAAQGESEEVAIAIRDQYLPKFVGDALPETVLGQALSIADKMDTLCGIFAVGKKPSGSKDPFALRRAALGVIHILKDKSLPLNYDDLIEKAIEGIEKNCNMTIADEVRVDVRMFFTERLRNQFIKMGYSHDVFSAVKTLAVRIIADIEPRLLATEKFKKQPYARSLIEAEKRAMNIVGKANLEHNPCEMNVDPELFTSDYEHNLYQQLTQISDQFAQLVKNQEYDEGYRLLSRLAAPLDEYFENVMVNTDDENIRLNRLVQLANFSKLTASIAELSNLVIN